MDELTTYVGMDAHKEWIVIAMLAPGGVGPVEWRVVNEPGAVRRMARKLLRLSKGPVHCCYEAGPGGYVLKRQLGAEGVSCCVIAPSLIPVKPGVKIKTDRRDARKLAELLRAGLLTEVHPPSPGQEAVRDLCRARDDAQRDLTRARNRLSKFLLRRACRYGAARTASWSQRYRTWLHSQKFEEPSDQVIFEDYLMAVEQVEARLDALKDCLEKLSQEEPWRGPVGALRCFRGIDTVTAMALVAELHEPARFPSARQLMAYLGLVPRESSSGERRRQGGITASGNAHLRRLLVEAAWHYRHKPFVGPALRQRRRGQPAVVVALADRALRRLTLRHRRMVYRGKHPNTTTVAIARELVGYVWGVLVRKAEPQLQQGGQSGMAIRA